MARELDGAAIDIPCPGCDHKNRKTFRWLKKHNQLTCAGCRKVIDLESSGFRKGMREVDAEMAKVAKTLRKLGSIKF